VIGAGLATNPGDPNGPDMPGEDSSSASPRCRDVPLGSLARLAVLSVGLAVLLGGRPAAHAADSSLLFNRLGVEEGLSSNWVLAVLRDRRGFLWVGTQDGLNRYDGHQFVTYRPSQSDSHSLPFSVAGVLFEDSRGRLWVGSRWASEGMALYDRELDRFVRLPQGRDGTGLGDPRVNAIVDAPDGRLWVGTPKGVDRVDPDRGTFENFGLAPAAPGQEPPRQTTALLSDRRGTLWVGTTLGLYHLDRDQKRCVAWRGFDGQGATGLEGARIEALLEDASGTLWVATLTNGLFEIDVEGRRIRQHVPRAGDSASLSHIRTRSLALDGEGRLWVGTENGGLNALDRRTGRFTRYAPDPFTPGTLGSASIYALLADHQGVLWIGTYDAGLNYVSPALHRFPYVAPSTNGLRDPRVSAFWEDREGNLWIGTDGGGFCRVDAGSGKYACGTHDPAVPTTIGSSSVLTLIESKDGMIWMGGWGGGLSRLDPRTGKFKRFRHSPDDPATLVGDDVWRVRQLQSGELLVATQQGADLLDPASGRSSRLSARYPGIVDQMTIAIAEEQDGDLWIGQNNQVQHIARATGKVTTYAHGRAGPLYFERGQVFVVFEDSRKNLWIGGEGGLRVLPGSRPVGSALTEVEGLPHRVVTNVLEDSSGNIWVTTHRGLSRLTGAVEDPAHPSLIHFDVRDGLQGSGFSRGAAYKGRDGRLYFGGPRGFNVFMPEAISLNTEPPPVVLTDLRVFNRRVLPGTNDSLLKQAITETKVLSISQDQFVLTFEFAALNLVLPQKNRYAYMLQGLENNWNESGTRHEATYTQLRRGDYVLRVRASNNDGVWNDAGLSLRLHVEPRWHEVTSTRVLLALLGALLVLGALGWRARQFTLRERDLTRRVEERTRALHELNDKLEQRVVDRTAELAQEKERLSVTMRSIGDAVIATDVESHVLLMNRVAEQVTGFLSDQARGQKLRDVMPRLDPKTRKPKPDPVAAVLGENPPQPLPSESLLLRPTGEEIIVAESAAPIRNQEGQTLGVVLAFRDVTKQRKLEQQLQNSQKLEALGILAGGIAHDFNNLLTALFGYLAMARRLSGEAPKQAGVLAKALELIDKARGLTGQLLTFSRGGAPVTAPLQLRDQLPKNVEFALSGSNITCEVRMADDLWFCLGDRRQIDQVFDNLLLNARQAMPNGGSVTLVAENAVVNEASGIPLPAGRYLRVTVHDQGPGIPKEIQSRIFEPFFTTKTKGTGLGLATTYSIVRKHGGHIELASEPNQGACFSVYLPAVEESIEGTSKTSPPAMTTPCHVLLMDDDASVRDVVQTMLRALGHTVEAVAEGQAAISAYQSARSTDAPFDLVLLDLTIPGGLGGRAVLARLVDIDPNVIAVAASGYSADPIMADPRAHGFAAKLSKPFSIDDLASVIARVLPSTHVQSV
jgi:PAS domain S-box-containing protein